MIALNKVDVEQIVSEEMNRYKGDAILNLKVKNELNAIDYLINLGITAGGYMIGMAIGASSSTPYESYKATISFYASSMFVALAPFLYSSRTVTIEGDIVQYKDK